MPLAKYLLDLRFDKSGPINTKAINLGRVFYDDESALPQGGRSAYFQPYTDFAGLWLQDASDVESHIKQNKDFTIYAKYKIDSYNLDKDTIHPIISYREIETEIAPEPTPDPPEPGTEDSQLIVEQPEHGRIEVSYTDPDGNKHDKEVDTLYNLKGDTEVTIQALADEGYETNGLFFSQKDLSNAITFTANSNNQLQINKDKDSVIDTDKEINIETNGNDYIFSGYASPLADTVSLRVAKNDKCTIKINGGTGSTFYFTPGEEITIEVTDIPEGYELVRLSLNDDQVLELEILKSFTVPFLYIEEASYFTFAISSTEKYSSKIVDYTFDNRWHTVTVTRKGNKLRIFVDGCLSTTNTIKSENAWFGKHCYIGWHEYNHNVISTFNGGWLDDIVILDDCLYTSSFVPPTLYLTQEDSINNYLNADQANIYELEQEVIDQTEKKMRSAVHHFNEAQIGYLPQRVRIEWYENDSYFRETEWTRESKTRDFTVISLYNMIHPLLGYEDNRFFEGNAFTLLNQGQIQGFMLFVDKKFVPLSQIQIIRSDYWYTVFIKNRDPFTEGSVKSVEFITIPFPILYDEFLGEREDNTPIYRFNKDGYFDGSADAVYFYYIDTDPDKSVKVKTSGIYEQNIPSYTDNKETGDENFNDGMFMHYSWRYGTFEEKRVIGNNVLMQFRAWDHGYMKPGDTVLIYKNTILIDPERYRIVGADLVEFFDYKGNENYPPLNIANDNLFTLQIITDSNEGYLFNDFTDTRMIRMTATIDNQSVFQIPIDELPSEKTYNSFLVFRGSVCMNDENRFIIDLANNTLTFTNTEDFVVKGTDVLLFFVNINKSSQNGPLHLKPYYLYTTTEFSDSSTQIKIPELNGLQFNMNNVMVFIQDTFLTPRQYYIEDNMLHLMETNHVFNSQENVVFVALKMVSEYEDPTSDRYEVIKNQIEQGKRFVLYDLNVPRNVKLTLDNFIVFDNHGRYMPDLYGQIYNRNIIKALYSDEPLDRVPRYLCCLYLDDSYDNEANAVLPTNDSFINGYITLMEEFYEMDDHFQEFMSDFNHRYYKNKHYGENLSRALDYMVCYNQSKFDPVYERRATAYRFDIDANKFNDALVPVPGGGYKLTMDTAKFVDRFYRAYPIFFLNGIIPTWYDRIEYSGNTMTVNLDDMVGYEAAGDVNPTYYSLNVIQPEHADIYVNGVVGTSFSLRANSAVTLEIVPHEGYKVDNFYMEELSRMGFNIPTPDTAITIDDIALADEDDPTPTSSNPVVTIKEMPHVKILVNGQEGTSFSFEPGTEVKLEAIPDEGYQVDRLWFENELTSSPVYIDSFEVIKCTHINNYLEPLNSKIRWISHNMREILCKVTVGMNYGIDIFDAQLTVTPHPFKQNLLPSTLEVKWPWTIGRNDYMIEFGGQIMVNVVWDGEEDLDGTLEDRTIYSKIVVDEPVVPPDYTPPEGLLGPEYYEIYCKVTPAYEFTPYDLYCSITVPYVAIRDDEYTD